MKHFPPHAYRVLPALALCLLPGLVYGWAIWRGYPDSMFGVGAALVVRDYVNIWAGGTLVLDGNISLLFKPQEYWDWLRSVFSARIDLHTWGYPPHLIFLAVPLACLPLVQGFFAWTVGTLFLLWSVLRRAGLERPFALAVVLSPAAVENALAGQNGALTTTALAGGLLLAGQRPVLAGALLGLLSLKPQLGLLAPVCLLASRDFRTVRWTAVFVGVYCVASGIAFGWASWVQYLTVITPFMRSVLEAPFGLSFQHQMPTPFMSARAAGADLATAYLIQAAVTLPSLLLVWRAWERCDADKDAAVALTLTLAPLATPYAHSYDLLCVSVAVALLARRGFREGFQPFERCSLLLAWLWPGAAFMVGVGFCDGLGPLFLLPSAACAWFRLSPDAKPAQPRLSAAPM